MCKYLLHKLQFAFSAERASDRRIEWWNSDTKVFHKMMWQIYAST